MFNFEINIINTVCIVLQIAFFFFAIYIWRVKPKEKFRLRYVFLLFFLLFCHLILISASNKFLDINAISMDIVCYSVGISCTTYILYYLYKDLNIKPARFLDITSVSNILVLDFIFLYIIPYTICGDSIISKNLFLLIPSLLGITIFLTSFFFLWHGFKREKENNKLRFFFGAITLLFLTSIPLIMYIYSNNYQIGQLLLTIGFLIISFSFFLKLQSVSSNEKKVIKNLIEFQEKELWLTDEEKEKIYLMLICSENNHFKLIKSHFSQLKLMDLKNRIYSTLIRLDNSIALPKIDYNNFQEFNKFQLTHREMEIAVLIIKNQKYKDIASKMFVTEKTITKHASNIFKKIGIKNKYELINMFTKTIEE